MYAEVKSALFKIEKVDESNLKDIPDPCKCCLYWQTSGDFTEKTLKPEIEQEKRELFNTVTKEFGDCMKIAYLDSIPVGFMHYAPPRFFPNVKEYESGPPSDDAVFIACLYIVQDVRGNGYGSTLLKELITELRRGGYKAVETFARKSSANNPSGPLKLYLKHEFSVRTEKDDFPLVRLEL